MYAGLSGMLFRLICLYRNGAPLNQEDLFGEPRYTGNLVIEDWPQGGAFGRAVRQARLLDMTIPTTPRDLLAPLFDPQLARMTSSQMTLHGYQIHAEAGAAVHYAQCWALRQVADLYS
jgi:hypothetical protein